MKTVTRLCVSVVKLESCYAITYAFSLFMLSLALSFAWQFDQQLQSFCVVLSQFSYEHLLWPIFFVRSKLYVIYIRLVLFICRD